MSTTRKKNNIFKVILSGVAAAAIIAKVYRDHLMDKYDKQYPGYEFAANKGYPTEAHLRAVEEQGPCPIHRMTFRPLCEGAKQK